MATYHCFAMLKTTDGGEACFDGIVETQEPVTTNDALKQVRQSLMDSYGRHAVTSVTIQSFTRLD
jgi:hypothetical protein